MQFFESHFLYQYILTVFAKRLTLNDDIQAFAEYAVAPHVGAWIETSIVYYHSIPKLVAPHVGAWIETTM